MELLLSISGLGEQASTCSSNEFYVYICILYVCVCVCVYVKLTIY